MSNQERYLTTKEAAAELGVSVPTIYKYVKENKLKPVYEDKWQIDETLLFEPEVVMNLKEKEKRPDGFTTGEVAKELGVHPTTVSSYIKDGLLKANKHRYKGRYIYFISSDEMETFKRKNEHLKKRETKSFYLKEENLYLYQTLINQQTTEIARIIELSQDSGKVLTEDGQIFPLEQMKERGYKTKEQFLDRKYSTKRGYVKFSFQKPSHIESPVYKLIELFYRESGYKNVRLDESEGAIVIEVKPILLSTLNEEENEPEIKLLENNLLEGNITIRHNGVLLDSDLDPLTVYVPKKLKRAIRKTAKKRETTMDEYVTEILKKEVEKE